MKKKFLDFSLKLIKENRKDIDPVRLDEIRYGLEGFYLTVTKFIVISILALILNIFVEMIILLIFFNILRRTGFGMHAGNSYICLLSSSLIFIGLPFLAKILVFPLYLKSGLLVLAVIMIYKNTPADTSKRPLINKKKRDYFKFVTTLKCIIMAFIAMFINNNLSNLLIMAIYIEVVLTSPYVYKLFHLSYNNYLSYQVLNSNV